MWDSGAKIFPVIGILPPLVPQPSVITADVDGYRALSWAYVRAGDA